MDVGVWKFTWQVKSRFEGERVGSVRKCNLRGKKRFERREGREGERGRREARG